MNWFRRFFHDDDPIEPLLFGLFEPEAEMYRELLSSSGVPAALRNTSSLAVYRAPMAGSFDVLIRRSDVDRAREVIDSLVEDESEWGDEEPSED